MRNFINIVEGKWWDDEPTITLYHGTSSALLPMIRKHGLHPPQEDLKAYAHDILRHYLPEEKWTPALLKMVDEHAVRAMAGRADDRGPVIFCKTHADGVEGYARAYAKDGGEIAMDVRRCVLLATKGGDELKWRELMKHDIPPRYPDGKPVVLQIEVPKSWCLFDHDLDQMKSRIAQANAEGKSWAQGDLGEVYDGVFEDREVRITRPVPLSMILSITEIDEETIAEAVVIDEVEPVDLILSRADAALRATGEEMMEYEGRKLLKGRNGYADILGVYESGTIISTMMILDSETHPGHKQVGYTATLPRCQKQGWFRMQLTWWAKNIGPILSDVSQTENAVEAWRTLVRSPGNHPAFGKLKISLFDGNTKKPIEHSMLYDTSDPDYIWNDDYSRVFFVENQVFTPRETRAYYGHELQMKLLERKAVWRPYGKGTSGHGYNP